MNKALLILVGPSAVGKTTVADEIISRGGFSLIRSLTTRAPRGDGHDDEYIYTDSAWEKLGNTDIDTTNFVLKSELVAITNTEIDNMVNG